MEGRAAASQGSGGLVSEPCLEGEVLFCGSSFHANCDPVQNKKPALEQCLQMICKCLIESGAPSTWPGARSALQGPSFDTAYKTSLPRLGIAPSLRSRTMDHCDQHVVAADQRTRCLRSKDRPLLRERNEGVACVLKGPICEWLLWISSTKVPLTGSCLSAAGSRKKARLIHKLEQFQRLITR